MPRVFPILFLMQQQKDRSRAATAIDTEDWIVLKEGKELGRVIEYGKTGLWDKELGELINSSLAK